MRLRKRKESEAGAHYLDSVMNNPVWLGAYSLKRLSRNGD